MKRLQCILALFAAVAGVGTAATAENTLSGQALVEALRTGGYNIYFRHTATDWSQNDQVHAVGDWTSCDPRKMRQLSEEGRAAAQRIGRAIRRLAIPVGPVVASEYCRARETAQNMDLGLVRATRAVMNMRAAGWLGGAEAVVERARQALATPPPEGTNAVYVAHGNLMRAVSGAYTAEGGAIVLAPLGGGRFQRVAQLRPHDWQELAEAHADF